ILIESLMLAAIGGAGGLAIAYVGRDGVAPFTPRLDWRMLPSPRSFRSPPASCSASRRLWLQCARRSPTASGAVPSSESPSSGFQIALATLLLIGAGLFIRSLAGLTAVNPGFRTDRLLLAQIVLPQNRYPGAASVAFHQRMEQAIANIPGVASVSAAEVPYLAGDHLQTNFLPQGEAIDASTDHTEPYNAVGSHFFETLGIPMT